MTDNWGEERKILSKAISQQELMQAEQSEFTYEIREGAKVCEEGYICTVSCTMSSINYAGGYQQPALPAEEHWTSDNFDLNTRISAS